MNNDHYEDVVMLGDKGSHVFKFATNAGITDMSRFSAWRRSRPKMEFWRIWISVQSSTC